MNRIANMIGDLRPKINALPAEKAISLDEGMALTLDDYFQYQNLKSEMQVSGLITVDEALTVYGALGAGYRSANGGWDSTADTATKVTVTKLISEYLTRKVGR